MKNKDDKRTESQFDMPEGADWSWTSESQDELMRGIEAQSKKESKNKSTSFIPKKIKRPF
mgnify:FL=1